jgi:hypothetical protein
MALEIRVALFDHLMRARTLIDDWLERRSDLYRSLAIVVLRERCVKNTVRLCACSLQKSSAQFGLSAVKTYFD